MRKPCLGCVLKHLGAAAVLEEECRNGYPAYDFLVLGHLDQASAESWGVNQTLAKVIRQHRVNFQYKPGYDIPFEPLANYVRAVIGAEDDPAAAAALMPPKDVLAGIETDKQGNPVFDGDTRP